MKFSKADLLIISLFGYGGKMETRNDLYIKYQACAEKKTERIEI